MLDLLAFAAIAAAVVVAILAMLKVMIEFPGMGDWCLRVIHKKTGKKNEVSVAGEDNSLEEIIIHDVGLNHVASTRCEKTDPTSSKSVSRTSTETEMFRRRFEEIDEILSAEKSGEIIPSGRLQEIREKTNLDRRHSSHDQSHRSHHHKHHHNKRRHSHSHDPHRHHRRHHHHQDHHHHHQNHSSNTDVEYDHSPGKSRSQNVHSSTEMESVDCSPRRYRAGQTSSQLGTPERINQLVSHSKVANNMRININNVNILINRHTQKDVTINIDMEDTGEVEAQEEHHDEVRSSDSGIGWDLSEADHQEQEGQQATHQMEPVLEELERNVIVEREEPRKEAGEGEGMFKLETIPKRLRHNTYS